MKIISGEKWSGITSELESRNKKIQELEAQLEEAKKAVLDLVKEKLLKQFPEYNELLSCDEIVQEIWSKKLELRPLPENMLEQKPTNDTVTTFTQDGDWVGGGGHEEHFSILYLDDSGKIKREYIKPREFNQEKDADQPYSVFKERYLKSDGENIAEALGRVNRPLLVICEKRDDVTYGFVFSDRTKTTAEGFLHQGIKKEDEK